MLEVLIWMSKVELNLARNLGKSASGASRLP